MTSQEGKNGEERETLHTISPSTNKPILTRSGPTKDELAVLLQRSRKGFAEQRSCSLSRRQAVVSKVLSKLRDEQDGLARELTEQMGRPIAYTGVEITTAVKRGEYLLKISEEALKDTPGQEEEGFRRYIVKEPAGVVLIIFAWNVSPFHSRFFRTRFSCLNLT